MTSQQLQLIITIPHRCIIPKFLDPPCDPNTYQFGKIIAEWNPTAKVVVSTNLRRACDNNRRQCRDTTMRKKLKSLMQEFAPDFIVLDVHSFPDGDSFRLDWDPEIIFLDVYPSLETTTLNALLENEGFKTATLEGSDENDIQIVSRGHGGRAILLELNSRLLSEEDVNLVGKVIQEWHTIMQQMKE